MAHLAFRNALSPLNENTLLKLQTMTTNELKQMMNLRNALLDAMTTAKEIQECAGVTVSYQAGLVVRALDDLMVDLACAIALE